MSKHTNAFKSLWIGPGGDLTDAFAIRTKVFIEEQQVPAELEMDEIDPLTDHLVIYIDDKPVATGRIVWDTPVTLGRIAVLSEYRGSGLGADLVLKLVDKVFSQGVSEVHLHAQTQAVGFYEKLGFVAYGELYEDAGIPHIYAKECFNHMMTLLLVESKTGFVRLELAEESLQFGTCKVDIKSGGYRASGELSMVGHQLRRFYNVMVPVVEATEGEAVFFDSDCLLEIHYRYVNKHRIIVHGRFQEEPSLRNELKFQLETDQADVEQMMGMLADYLHQNDR